MNPLSEYEIQALNRAIDEERMAKALHEGIMITLGHISPFDWIAKEEQMHIDWVARLMKKYNLEIPPDRWAGKIIKEPASEHEARTIGARAEFENAGIFDMMIPKIEHTDIIATFNRLRSISREKHLPALQ